MSQGGDSPSSLGLSSQLHTEDPETGEAARVILASGLGGMAHAIAILAEVLEVNARIQEACGQAGSGPQQGDLDAATDHRDCPAAMSELRRHLARQLDRAERYKKERDALREELDRQKKAVPADDPDYYVLCDAIDEVFGWKSEEEKEAGDYPARVRAVALELAGLQEEHRALRQCVIGIVNGLGNGSRASDTVSTEFLCAAEREVAVVLDDIRRELAAAKEAAARSQQVIEAGKRWMSPSVEESRNGARDLVLAMQALAR